MSSTAFALLGLVAWMLLLLMLLVTQRGLLVLTGQMAINSFAADGSNVGRFAQRLSRAHANCVENLPMFAAVLLYALFSGQTALTDPLALLLLGARVVQSSTHLLSISALFVWFRFAAFFVQIAIVIWWLLHLFAVL